MNRKTLLTLTLLLISSVAHSHGITVREDNDTLVEATFTESVVLDFNTINTYPAYYSNEDAATGIKWGPRFVGQTRACTDTTPGNNIPQLVRDSQHRPQPNGSSQNGNIKGEPNDPLTLVASRSGEQIFNYPILRSATDIPRGTSGDSFEDAYQWVSFSRGICGDWGDAGMAVLLPIAATGVSFDLYLDVIRANENSCRLGQFGTRSRVHLLAYDDHGVQIGHNDLTTVTDEDGCPLRLSFTSSTPIRGFIIWPEDQGGWALGRVAFGEADEEDPVEPPIPTPETLEERVETLEGFHFFE